VAVATFGKVSVVMIALAASSQPLGVARVARSSMTAANLLAAGASQMTPVEASMICLGRQPIALAANSAVSLTASRPLLPVNALALPELTTSPRATPAASRARHHSTG